MVSGREIAEVVRINLSAPDRWAMGPTSWTSTWDLTK